MLPALTKAKAVPSESKVVADEPLTLTLVLKRDDQVGFERYLREVYDPKSLNYRKFLTQSELSDRFGPWRKTYDNVLSYLQDKGFTLVEGSANRLTLTVRGTRTRAENAFDVRLQNYRIGEKSFFANDVDPALPHDIASSVHAVIGLANLARPHGAGQSIGQAFENYNDCMEKEKNKQVAGVQVAGTASSASVNYSLTLVKRFQIIVLGHRLTRHPTTGCW